MAASGLVDEADIQGNVEADKRANKGRALRKHSDEFFWGVKDRRHVTKLTQEFLLRSETMPHMIR